MDLYDAIIVGGGPAGSAAAIHLARKDPAVASRTLLLDAAVFPREKLCGGGIVWESRCLLNDLGVKLDVPSVSVRALRWEYEGGSAIHRGEKLLRVVRREEFDHALLRIASARGVKVREGEPVVRLRRERDHVLVETRRAEYRARVVIGADGANSVVRRSLVGAARGDRFVALGVLTPPRDRREGDSDIAVMDFRPVARGLRGYTWDFPSRRRGERWINRGMNGARWPEGVSLRQLFTESLEARGVDLDGCRIEGGTAPIFHPESPQSAERVVLAGDAVGVDPLLGEGISVAIGTGMLAANAVTTALAAQRFDFSDYGRYLRGSSVGRRLCANHLGADRFYEDAAKLGGLATWVGNGGA
jgi:geranylgeranyl reductase family protein